MAKKGDKYGLIKTEFKLASVARFLNPIAGSRIFFLKNLDQFSNCWCKWKVRWTVDKWWIPLSKVDVCIDFVLPVKVKCSSSYLFNRIESGFGKFEFSFSDLCPSRSRLIQIWLNLYSPLMGFLIPKGKGQMMGFVMSLQYFTLSKWTDCALLFDHSNNFTL